MKGKVFVLGAVLAAFVISGVAAQQNRRGGSQGQDGALDHDLTSVLADLPVQELSQAEIEGLLRMREEEKLARDVYLTLADIWSIRAFENIARAEETHMNAVALILQRYGIKDPVVDTSVGSFTSPLMQELFAQLVETGGTSQLDALKVGAKVEELDIADLQELMAVADNDDILVVYQNLLKGSRNHLRTFEMQISRNGGTYTPEHISEEEYKSIASSPRETGTVITDPKAF